MNLLDRLIEARAALIVADRYGVPSKDALTREHYADATRILGEVIADLRAGQPPHMRADEVLNGGDPGRE